MSETSGGDKRQELMPKGEVIEFMQEQIANWRFEEETPNQNIWFTYVTTRWMLEYFGHVNAFPTGSEGKPSHIWGPIAEGIDGERLPEPLHPVITKTSHRGIYLLDHNDIMTRAQYQYQYMDADFNIPKWEEISKLPTIPEREEAIMNDPEIYENIKPPEVFIADTVTISLETYKAGLDFGVDDQAGMKVNVFGKSGYTREPSEFILKHFDNTNLLCQCTLGLAVLAAEGSEIGRRGLPIECKDKYLKWLLGLERPITNYSFVPPPPGMKYYYYRRLVEAGKIKPVDKEKS